MPDISDLIGSVVEVERTDKHSEKPEKFRRIIDTLYTYGPRIELFRRGDAPEGWVVWGDEASSNSGDRLEEGQPPDARAAS
jgi:N6-adenosine-specific RNA methylase IME4